MPKTPELAGALPREPIKGPKAVPWDAHLTVIEYLKPPSFRGLCPLDHINGLKEGPWMLILP